MTNIPAGTNPLKGKLPDTAKEIEELREKVRELEATLEAIHSGEVDAIIVAKGEQNIFFWAELAAEAKRLLREVDALARAYGWREADILALSSQRRHAYLELVWTS